MKSLTQPRVVKQIIILDLVKDEIKKGEDELSEWISQNDFRIYEHKTKEVIDKWQEVLQYLQECGKYKEGVLHSWAKHSVADPWLVAVARVEDYTIITDEVGSGGFPNLSNKANTRCG